MADLFTNLPEEVLVQIMDLMNISLFFSGYNNSVRDLKSLALVNRRFHRVAKSTSSLWAYVNLGYPETVPRQLSLRMSRRAPLDVICPIRYGTESNLLLGLEHSERWRSVDFTVIRPSADIEHLPDASFPLIHRVKLPSLDVYKHGQSHILYENASKARMMSVLEKWDLSAARILVVHGLTPTPGMFTACTNLTIDTRKRVYANGTEVKDFLRSLDSLLHLTMLVDGAHWPHSCIWTRGEMEEINLPHLMSFAFRIDIDVYNASTPMLDEALDFVRSFRMESVESLDFLFQYDEKSNSGNDKEFDSGSEESSDSGSDEESNFGPDEESDLVQAFNKHSCFPVHEGTYESVKSFKLRIIPGYIIRPRKVNLDNSLISLISACFPSIEKLHILVPECKFCVESPSSLVELAHLTSLRWLTIHCGTSVADFEHNLHTFLSNMRAFGKDLKILEILLGGADDIKFLNMEKLSVLGPSGGLRIFELTDRRYEWTGEELGYFDVEPTTRRCSLFSIF